MRSGEILDFEFECLTRTAELAEAYCDGLKWVKVRLGMDQSAWEPSLLGVWDPSPLPPAMRNAWGPMIAWASEAYKLDAESGHSLAADHPFQALAGALTKEFFQIEPALRELTDWRRGVPFQWFERARRFRGDVESHASQPLVRPAEDGLAFPLEELQCETADGVVERAERELHEFLNALEIVGREKVRSRKDGVHGDGEPSDRLPPSRMKAGKAWEAWKMATGHHPDTADPDEYRKCYRWLQENRVLVEGTPCILPASDKTFASYVSEYRNWKEPGRVGRKKRESRFTRSLAMDDRKGATLTELQNMLDDLVYKWDAGTSGWNKCRDAMVQKCREFGVSQERLQPILDDGDPDSVTARLEAIMKGLKE